MPRTTIRGLSPRQLEVLRLVAEGHADKQITDALSISRSTVKTYLSAVYAELAARNRAHAAAVAIQIGLIKVEVFAGLLNEQHTDVDTAISRVVELPRREPVDNEAVNEAVNAVDWLTPRELEVLCRLARGQLQRQIAHKMLVSMSTIKKIVHSLLHKLGAANAANAVAVAYEHGILKPAPRDKPNEANGDTNRGSS